LYSYQTYRNEKLNAGSAAPDQTPTMMHSDTSRGEEEKQEGGRFKLQGNPWRDLGKKGQKERGGG